MVPWLLLRLGAEEIVVWVHLRLRVLVVSTAARSVKEVNTAAVERSWREAFAAASPAQVRSVTLTEVVIHTPLPTCLQHPQQSLLSWLTARHRAVQN
jgi:hypothetical protein